MTSTVPSRWELYRELDLATAPGWEVETLVQPSRLFGSNGIRWAPDGLLWITEFNGEQVSRWDPATDTLSLGSPMGPDIKGPDDIAFDAAGGFYVTETLNGRVTGRHADGRAVVVLDDSPGANGITIDPRTDELYVDEMREGGRVLRLDKSGNGAHTVLADGLEWCNAMEMSAHGEMFFPQVFAGTVLALDPDTGELRTAVDGLAVPTAVKFDSQGRLVVSEAGAGVITAIDLTDGTRTTLAEAGAGIDNFCFDPAGRLYVSNFCEARVERYDANGRVTQRVSAGGLMGPYQVCADSAGRLFAADANTLVALKDGRPDRLTRLLIDQAFVAVGVASVGDKLLVLSLAGDVYARDADGTLHTVFTASADLNSQLLSTVQAAASAVSGDGTTGLIALTAGELVEIGSDLTLGRRHRSGLHTVSAVAIGDGRVAACDQAAGRAVVLDGDESYQITNLEGPRALALAHGALYVIELDQRRLVRIDPTSGVRETVCTGLPVGMPVGEIDHVRRCSLTVLPDGALVVGCDGDGGVRRLARRA